MSGWQPVYRVVRRIPSGRVATYGEVAAWAGMPGAARQVGWALAALGPRDDVPWHRVINAEGRISPRGGPEIEDLQRAMLESEGVLFGPGGRVDLARFGWKRAGRPMERAMKMKKQRKGASA
ncbi:MAG TPA: methyltransferase [Deltaproteobacteria bacterium]|nr:methyltransferase [Deltaproteobacteria bacterium]